MDFQSRLKTLRVQANISQKQLAEAINTTDRNYRRYEAGTQQPTLPILVALANYFNVSLDYLVGLSDNPKRL